MALRSKEDWTTYFCTIKTPDDASTTYAAIFHENHMTSEILADITADDHCQLSIEYLGTRKLFSITPKRTHLPPPYHWIPLHRQLQSPY